MLQLPVAYIPKVWGYEEVLVNGAYCCKKLHIYQGAVTSYHAHPLKHETFTTLEGEVLVNLEGKWIRVRENPVTIEPGQLHLIIGLTNAVLLEVSTTHSDEDVKRETESVYP